MPSSGKEYKVKIAIAPRDTSKMEYPGLSIANENIYIEPSGSLERVETYCLQGYHEANPNDIYHVLIVQGIEGVIEEGPCI